MTTVVHNYHTRHEEKIQNERYCLQPLLKVTEPRIILKRLF